MDLKIPDHWQHTPLYKTRTQLLQQRRKNYMPDISFDLDGDGVVGGTDCVIAKKFDLDQDGKLNQNQRSAALKAVNQGFGSDLIWGCDSSGINRWFRIVQKRGQGIVDQDFSQIKTTYPHSLQRNKTIKTKQDINDRLHREILQASKDLEKKLEFNFRLDLPAEKLIHTELYRNRPKYRSISQKKEVLIQTNREKMGLTKTNLLSRQGQIGLGYQQNPLNKTTNQLNKHKKEVHLKQLNKSLDFNHKLDYQRLWDRERRNEQPENNGITYRDIKEKARAEDFSHYQQTFTSRPQGVHGKQLPLFSKYKKHYWDQNTPKEQSQRSLLQQRKLTQALFRGKPEQMVLNDNDLQPPDDLVKRYKEHQRLVVQENPITEPPQRIQHLFNLSQGYSPRRAEFSTSMLKFLSIRRSSLGGGPLQKKKQAQQKLGQEKKVVFNSTKYFNTSMGSQLLMKGQLNYTHRRLRSGGFQQ